jgi:hypothetical protein
MSFYPPIEFMLLASGYIHEWSNILRHFRTSQTIFQAMVSATPLTKTNSCVLCRIRYTCQICVVGRNYILQRRSIFHVTWKSIPNPSKKTNKINKQISRQYFQPTKASNTGRTPTRRYFFFPYLSFCWITEFFFGSKPTSHKTSLSSFIWASIASLICLTCPWPGTLERRHPKAQLFDDREKWQ